MGARVFRIHIRPDGGANNAIISFQYCLDRNVLGVGWAIDVLEHETIDWSAYESRAVGQHQTINIVRYLYREVKINDLVWTRAPNGIYYIAKVIGPWHYLDNPEARNADIVNVFDVKLIQIPCPDDVPGAVIANFRAKKTLQPIKDSFAIDYSKKLWNELSNEREYEIIGNKYPVWSALTDEQVEDIVFIFLQMKGWVVIPNSRKKDTMSYEFLLIHRDSGDRAIVQAKTGQAVIDLSFYKDFDCKVFLFQPNGCYNGEFSEKLYRINSEDVQAFIYNNKGLNPGSILRWFDFKFK